MLNFSLSQSVLNEEESGKVEVASKVVIRKRVGSVVKLSSVDSKCGQCELLMLRSTGATMQEMKAITGAASNHLHSLRKAGVNVELVNGSYFIR